MSSIAITIKPKSSNRYIVELSLDKLEKLAASLGLYGADFRKSLARSEKDFREGSTQTIKSLSELVK